MGKTSRGDRLAQDDNYIEPYGADFSYRTWVNEKTSRITQYIKVERGVNINDVPPDDTPVIVVPCDCSVFTDPFLTINPADWNENDESEIATPGANGYEHIVHTPGSSNADLGGQFDIGGDFDICVEVDITELPTSISGGGSYFELLINEGIFQSNARLQIRGSAPNTAEYYLTSNGEFLGPATFGTITAPSTHFLRFTRSGTTVTAWVWNPISMQFEWDGNPAGNVHDGVWENDPTPQIRWNDAAAEETDYIGGTCKSFCINAGTKINP